MKHCCKYRDCKTSSLTKKRLYRFPKQVERCNQWVTASKNQSLIGVSALKLHEKARLCQDHFADWCFVNIEDKIRLVHNAVPDVEYRPSVTNDSTSTRYNISVEHSYCRPSVVPKDEREHPSSSVAVSNEELPEIPSTPTAEVCSPTTTKSTARKKYTPTKVKMAKIIKKKNDALRKLKENQNKFKKILEGYKRPKTQQLKETLSNANVDNKLINFIVRQIKLNSVKRQSHRFTPEEKLFAYSIMCKSRSAYRILRTILELPSETTLRRFLASKLSKPGINHNIIDSISTYLNCQPLQKRTFVLVFDEVSVKPKLIYNPVSDNVSGFEDFGELGRSQKVANQVLVFMIRSLQGKKKLPICYYISKGTVTADYLKIIVLHLIKRLEESNVCIKAIVCDQSTSNCRLFSLLDITPEKPFFIFNERKIFGIYDPPHLLKTLRRNLMKYDLKTLKGLVSFEYIRKFYEKDKERERQAAPKLSDKHIYDQGLNSMKVSLAAQVFSNSVSVGMTLMILAKMIPAQASPTAEFVGIINDLFDSVNGTSIHPLRSKKFHCAVQDSSPHLPFWKKLAVDIRSWKFEYHESSGDANLSKRRKLAEMKSQIGWLQTISSLIELYQDLKTSGFKYMMPRRLNQDCIENFFSRIRGVGGHNSNPTVYEFNSYFKIACVNSLTQVKTFKNCEDDMDKFFIELVKSPSYEVDSKVEDEIIQENFENLMSDSLVNGEFNFENNLDVFDFFEKNILSYLAGYVGRRVVKEIKCEVCTKALLDEEKQFSDINMFLYFKEYTQIDDENFKGLKYPSHAFFESFSSLAHLCDEVMNGILYKEHVLATLRRFIREKIYFEFLFVCVEHYEEVSETIIKLSSNLLLRIHLRELNRSIEKKEFDLKKLREAIKRRK